MWESENVHEVNDLISNILNSVELQICERMNETKKNRKKNPFRSADVRQSFDVTRCVHLIIIAKKKIFFSIFTSACRHIYIGVVCAFFLSLFHPPCNRVCNSNRSLFVNCIEWVIEFIDFNGIFHMWIYLNFFFRWFAFRHVRIIFNLCNHISHVFINVCDFFCDFFFFAVLSAFNSNVIDLKLKTFCQFKNGFHFTIIFQAQELGGVSSNNFQLNSVALLSNESILNIAKMIFCFSFFIWSAQLLYVTCKWYAWK